MTKLDFTAAKEWAHIYTTPSHLDVDYNDENLAACYLKLLEENEEMYNVIADLLAIEGISWMNHRITDVTLQRARAVLKKHKEKT